MDKKAKILMSLALIASIGCVSGVAYAAYSVSSDGASTILPISVSNIQVNQVKPCIEFVSVSNKIKQGHADGIITDDKLSLQYSYNEKIYLDSASTSVNLMYSYLKLDISFPNQTLFDHVNGLLVDKQAEFLSMNGRSNNWKPGVGNYDFSQYRYYTNIAKSSTAQCINIDSATKTINILIPTASDMSAVGGLFVRNVFNKNDVDSRTRIWNFNINFNFNILEQGEYNATLTSSVFQGVNIKTSVGQFQ